MQHQSLATKQWFGESAPKLSRFSGSDVALHHDVRLVAVAGVKQLVPVTQTTSTSTDENIDHQQQVAEYSITSRRSTSTSALLFQTKQHI